MFTGISLSLTLLLVLFMQVLATEDLFKHCVHGYGQTNEFGSSLRCSSHYKQDLY